MSVSEAHRRAADAANGCAWVPKPAGDPRALILAALPATRQDLRAATKLSSADTTLALTSLQREGVIISVRGRWVLR